MGLKQHGKDTVIIIDGHDISISCNSSNLTRKSDKHDTTGYGAKVHEFNGGPDGDDGEPAALGDSSGALGGTYLRGPGGPPAVLKPLVGRVVEMIRRPEGTGSGKPQENVFILIEEYDESAPVADYVKWTSKIQGSTEVVDSIQP